MWNLQSTTLIYSHRIKLQDALTLFQEYHGDAFSLHTWHSFIQSRSDPQSDVFFDELRDWLCAIPSGDPASDRQVKNEVSKMEDAHWDHCQHEYEQLKTLQVTGLYELDFSFTRFWRTMNRISIDQFSLCFI